MANFVTKKDGEKVSFDSEKVKASIMSACDDAGVEDEQKKVITEKISSVVMTSLENKEEVSSSEMKQMILSELDVLYPNVAEAWREYDQSKGE